MSESVSAVDADYARVSAASMQLAAALAQEHTGSDVKPGDLERAQAAVQAAESNLEQAQSALEADQAAASAATPAATPATPAAPAASADPSGTHSVTDPGGIVV